MYQFKLATETVEIKDGDTTVLTIICKQATGEEDASLSYLEMEGILANQADAKKLGGVEKITREMRQWHYFRSQVYPKLAACSKAARDGERLPTAVECYAWPSAPRVQWYNAAARVNPAWFDEFKTIADAAVKALDKLPASDPAYQELKKKEKKPRASRRHSAKA